MSTRDQVAVVDISSPSYTGTTWLCLLLGSHPRAFAVGAPDRVWNLLREGGGRDACRVHGPDCPLWSSFIDAYDPKENLYLQLAEASGRDVIVINNPTREHAAAELTHPDLLVKRMQIVRDGRALANSYARHHQIDYFDAVRDYVRGMYQIFSFERDRADVLAMRYEDLLRDQADHLDRFRVFLDLDYGDDALRYWEHEHHVTSGNAGAINLLKMLQGIDVPAHGRHVDFYRRQHERMTQNGMTFSDDRWQQEVGQRERFVFDHFCGRQNASWGYSEDAFTGSERERFGKELGAELRPSAAAVAASWKSRARHWLDGTSSALPRVPRRFVAMAVVAWLLSLVLMWIVAVMVAGR